MSEDGPGSTVTNGIMRWIERPLFQGLICLVVALVMRTPGYGDPNIHIDEGFYVVVGQWMHQGAWPYVDIWDRKPPLLFAIYGLIAFLPGINLPYQLVATGFAAATAFVITRLAVRMGAGQPGPLLAAIIYLVMLSPLGGLGGQSPVFYNLFIAFSALLVWRSRTVLKKGKVPNSVWFAMLFCGLAIATKQTAVFESVFLGLYVCVELYRGGAELKRVVEFAIKAALIGLSPFLFAFAVYGAIGHGDELWHAMVTSNFAKSGFTADLFLSNLTKTALVISPVLVMAIAGIIMAFRDRAERPAAAFLTGWISAAIVGFLSVPNAYEHYALPLLLPTTVAASFLLARSLLGVVLTAMILYWSLRISPMNYAMHARSKASVMRLAELINANLGTGERRVLIYDGAPIIYVLTKSSPGTPLVFPQHMLVQREHNVSHLNHAKELEKAIALRPRVVVLQEMTRTVADPTGFAQVEGYINQNCRLIGRQTLFFDNYNRENYIVYGNCRGE